MVFREGWGREGIHLGHLLCFGVCMARGNENEVRGTGFLFIHYYVIIMVNSFTQDTLQIHLLIYSTLLVSSLIIPFSKLTLIILFP